jgi:hypothetical protein
MSRKKYETPEDMQQALDAYFARCDEVKRIIVTKTGQVVTIPDPEPYTMSGLCVALGMSREAWREYHNGDRGPGYVEVCDEATQRVEHNMEVRLYRPSTFTVGLIFGLKNIFRWRDNHEITGVDGGPIVVKFDSQDAKL